MLSVSEKKETRILAVSMDSHDESRNLKYQIINEPGELDFPLLSDLHHEVTDHYGIFNPTEVSFKPGIPYPAVYLINKEGVVVHRFLDAEKYHRPTNQELRDEMKKLGMVK